MCVCLQGSSRSGQQFDVTVETFTGSHQQNKCMLFTVKWTQIVSSRGERNACHLTFSSSLDHFTEGGEFFLQGKTPIFLFTLLFSVYICDPNLCPYMLQTPFNSTVFTEQSSSYLLTFVCITEDESMGDLVTYSV